jgi:D-serine deaminase-like pyridoxal phosphate-dependent protein
MGGRNIEELRTPALLADLDVIERNITAMSTLLAGRDAKLRPHFKNHRVLDLARRQMDAGAIGLTVARLHHAERLLHAGIPSVLITNEVVTRPDITFLSELTNRFAPNQELLAVVDNVAVLRKMAAVSAAARRPISVLIDVDLGLERTGTDPLKAAELAEVAIANRLRLRGLFGYEGHVQRLAPGNEKGRVCREILGRIVDVARQLRAQGIPVDIVSTSGTGSANYAAETPEITEIQAGSYLLMEAGYEAAAPEFATALTVLATVISKTEGKRIVVDAGLKALSAERGMPTVRGDDGRLTLRALHAEHGIIDFTDPDVSVQVGDRLQINVHYGDATVNLHRRMFGVRDGIVTELLEIEA